MEIFNMHTFPHRSDTHVTCDLHIHYKQFKLHLGFMEVMFVILRPAVKCQRGRRPNAGLYSGQEDKILDEHHKKHNPHK